MNNLNNTFLVRKFFESKGPSESSRGADFKAEIKEKDVIKGKLLQEQKTIVEKKEIEKQKKENEQKKIEQLQQQIEGKNAEINTKTSQINGKNTEISKKNTDINQKQSSINNKDAEIGKSRENLGKISGELGKVSSELDRYNVEFRKIVARASVLRNSNEEHDKMELKAVEARIDSMRARMNPLLNQKKQLESQKKVVENDVRQKEGEKAKLSSELTSLQNAKKKLESEKRKIELDKKNLELDKYALQNKEEITSNAKKVFADLEKFYAESEGKNKKEIVNINDSKNEIISKEIEKRQEGVNIANNINNAAQEIVEGKNPTPDALLKIKKNKEMEQRFIAKYFSGNKMQEFESKSPIEKAKYMDESAKEFLKEQEEGLNEIKIMQQGVEKTAGEYDNNTDIKITEGENNGEQQGRLYNQDNVLGKQGNDIVEKNTHEANTSSNNVKIEKYGDTEFEVFTDENGTTSYKNINRKNNIQDNQDNQKIDNIQDISGQKKNIPDLYEDKKVTNSIQKDSENKGGLENSGISPGIQGGFEGVVKNIYSNNQSETIKTEDGIKKNNPDGSYDLLSKAINENIKSKEEFSKEVKKAQESQKEYTKTRQEVQKNIKDAGITDELIIQAFGKEDKSIAQDVINTINGKENDAFFAMPVGTAIDQLAVRDYMKNLSPGQEGYEDLKKYVQERFIKTGKIVTDDDVRAFANNLAIGSSDVDIFAARIRKGNLPIQMDAVYEKSNNPLIQAINKKNDKGENLRYVFSNFEKIRNVTGDKTRDIIDKTGGKVTIDSLMGGKSVDEFYRDYVQMIQESRLEKSRELLQTTHELLVSNNIIDGSILTSPPKSASEAQKFLKEGKKIPVSLDMKRVDIKNKDDVQMLLYYKDVKAENMVFSMYGKEFPFPKNLDQGKEQFQYIQLVQKMAVDPVFTRIFQGDYNQGMRFMEQKFAEKYPTEKIGQNQNHFYEVMFSSLGDAMGEKTLQNMSDEKVTEMRKKFENPDHMKKVLSHLKNTGIIDNTGKITEASLMLAKEKTKKPDEQKKAEKRLETSWPI